MSSAQHPPETNDAIGARAMARANVSVSITRKHKQKLETACYRDIQMVELCKRTSGVRGQRSGSGPAGLGRRAALVQVGICICNCTSVSYHPIIMSTMWYNLWVARGALTSPTAVYYQQRA